jgi:hypothetical protein
MTVPPAMYQYDRIWQGAAHRNFCIPMRDGRATVKVDGMPEYQLYFVRSGDKPASAAIYGEGLETPGRIDVDTPDEPHLNGDVCLEVAR